MTVWSSDPLVWKIMKNLPDIRLILSCTGNEKNHHVPTKIGFPFARQRVCSFLYVHVVTYYLTRAIWLGLYPARRQILWRRSYVLSCPLVQLSSCPVVRAWKSLSEFSVVMSILVIVSWKAAHPWIGKPSVSLFKLVTGAQQDITSLPSWDTHLRHCLWGSAFMLECT